MLTTFRNAWKIEELRKKLLFTLFVIVIFRFGSAITVPFLDPSAIKSLIGDGSLLGYFDMLTGGGFSSSTLFALSVTPYINASIIIQLLTVAIPALERMAKEGEEGRRKITRITRYVGCGIALALSIAYYFLLRSQGSLSYTTGFSGVFSAIVIVLSFTAGSMLIMWLGEQIDTKGIGNGISILIFAGIVSRFGSVLSAAKDYFLLGIGYSATNADATPQAQYLIGLPIILIFALVSVAFIVILSAAERRIPVQYAKRVVGRKQYGGQSTHIPIKVNMSGVMPIIFASALISIPGTIRSLFNITGFWGNVLGIFNYNAWGYAVIYTLLIIAFNFFYVAIQYNPIEIANNLRKNNGAVPGIRPGKPTSDFINKILSKITLIGAVFLAVVAILPIIIGNLTGMNIQLGGTSLLIVVGVALDTSRQLESYMLMRHHKGFLE
ncbi:MAG: preprotein translocase subunit SecY [Oscillospiraceae bacterium]|nr:preprotein translocase subunit SecY [Oscillospiraceae bacterium]